MLAFLILVLRTLIAICLFAFLGWAIYTLWRDLRFQSQMITTRKIPALVLSTASEPDETKKTFTVPELTIGRDNNCDFVLQDETVSSRHARLTYRYLQWWLEDIQSTNGTFLNDERVETPTIVISGDEIRVGQVILLLEIQPLES